MLSGKQSKIGCNTEPTVQPTTVDLQLSTDKILGSPLMNGRTQSL